MSTKALIKAWLPDDDLQWNDWFMKTVIYSVVTPSVNSRNNGNVVLWCKVGDRPVLEEISIWKHALLRYCCSDTHSGLFQLSGWDNMKNNSLRFCLLCYFSSQQACSKWIHRPWAEICGSNCKNKYVFPYSLRSYQQTKSLTNHEVENTLLDSQNWFVW